VCDEIDNDCDGQVDEGAALCSGFQWSGAEGVPDATTSWRAVAAYGPYAAQSLWLASSGGKLMHVASGGASEYTCAGEWRAAWARPSDGRVFLGGAGGKLATMAALGGECTVLSAPSAADVNGLVGFEDNGTTTVFAVTSDGRILRWASAGNLVTEVTRVAANLRDIHGTSPDTLLAVGAQDFDPQARGPRLYRATPGGEWVKETLPSGLPAEFLRGVHVLTGQLAYAVGDQGMVLERREGAWHTLAAPPRVGDVPPDLRAVLAFGRTALYALSNQDEVLLYDVATSTWSPVASSTHTLHAMDGVEPRDIWVVGDNGSYVRWSN
jgi:hypothetical protein